MFEMLEDRLGADTASELRDVLIILEQHGQVRIDLMPDHITVRLPKDRGGVQKFPRNQSRPLRD